MPIVGLMVCLLLLIPLYFLKEKDTIKENAVFEAQNSKLRYYNGRVAPGTPAGLLKNYTEEFRYANEMYTRLWAGFQKRHPIGSFFDWEDNQGHHTMIISNESQQQIAFDRGYIFAADGPRGNGAAAYCIWEARQHVIRMGYAPDNVVDKIFDGYSVCYDTSPGMGKNYDKRYETKFHFIDGKVSYQDMDRLSSGEEPPYRWGVGILAGSESYDIPQEMILEALQKYEDRVNAVIRHRHEIGQLKGTLRVDPEKVTAYRRQYKKSSDFSGNLSLIFLIFTAVLWLAVPIFGRIISGEWSLGVILGFWVIPAAIIGIAALYCAWKNSLK